MSPFNFQSIQSLEISKDDHPEIDVRDGRLVLTAQRGTERIMITAPIAGMVPVVAKRTVKTVNSKVTTLPSTDKRVGENHALAKLTESEVREIKNILKDKKLSNSFKNKTKFYQELGKAYKVHFTTIANIACGASWKHVEA